MRRGGRWGETSFDRSLQACVQIGDQAAIGHGAEAVECVALYACRGDIALQQVQAREVVTVLRIAGVRGNGVDPQAFGECGVVQDVQRVLAVAGDDIEIFQPELALGRLFSHLNVHFCNHFASREDFPVLLLEHFVSGA